MVNIRYAKSCAAEAFGLFSVLLDESTENQNTTLTVIQQVVTDAVGSLKSYGVGQMSPGNLLLAIDPFLPFEAFLDRLLTMDSGDLAYYILGECIPLQVLQESMAMSGALKSYYNRLDYTNEVSLQTAKAVVLNVERVRTDLVQGLRACHQWLEDSKGPAFSIMQGEFYHRVKTALEERLPLQVAQELMGKQFRRISEYTHYMFISVPYQAVPCVRYFNDETLIVVKRLEAQQTYTPEELVKHLKVLSDQTRLEILKALSEKPCFGIELSERFKVSRPTISHHLELLNSVGLVHIERDKNTKYYSLNALRYNALIEQLQLYIKK